MSGETNLNNLLASLKAKLNPDTYVFVTLPHDTALPFQPRMIFQEAEGTTLICTMAQARTHGLVHEYESRMITLDIHSSLEAVGFMAVIATRLAAAGLSVNPVSAFYHDHIFVPTDRADDAMALLAEIAANAAGLSA